MNTARDIRRTRERGSALFIIFIAIVLLAALSFAVADMMRGGVNPDIVTTEKAKLYADEILDYTRVVRQATQSVRINGCSDLGVSFENGFVSGYTHSPAANDKCKIFGEDGGGVSYMTPVEQWLDTAQSANALYQEWYFPARVCINGVGTPDSGACHTDGLDNEDILIVLPYIKKEICIALNDKLDVSNPGGDPPAEGSGNAWPGGNPKFQGSQTNNVRLNQDDQMYGCFEGNPGNNPSSGTYHFFHVLVPR